MLSSDRFNGQGGEHDDYDRVVDVDEDQRVAEPEVSYGDADKRKRKGDSNFTSAETQESGLCEVKEGGDGDQIFAALAND